jgi:DNA-binding CsgD family transcriptional regulator
MSPAPVPLFPALAPTGSELRTILLATLARQEEGIIVVDAGMDVVFSCDRARALLQRFGCLGDRDERADLTGGALPTSLVVLVRELAASTATHGTHKLRGRDMTLQIVIGSLSHSPRRFVLWLRDTPTKDARLFTVMNARYGVTRRAFQLAVLVREGMSNREIATTLRLSLSTVKVYLHQLYRACSVKSRTGLIALMNTIRQEDE